MLILISKINFIFSDFCKLLFVVQNARSALDFLVNPISSQMTPFTANSPNFSATGSKRVLHHFSVNCPISEFLLCKVCPSASAPFGT